MPCYSFRIINDEIDELTSICLVSFWVSMTGMEKFILKFFQELPGRREKIISKDLVEKSRFERELKRLEFSINYEKGSSSRYTVMSAGGKRVVCQRILK